MADTSPELAPQLVERIRRSEEFIRWLDPRINGVVFEANDRLRLSSGCLDMVHEHQKAIVLLVANQLTGSAFALVRMIFEAYLRGVWLHQCATEAEVEEFKGDRLHLSMKSLIDRVETLDGFKAGILSATKQKSWAAMNSFTHTGYAQAVRRLTEESIEPNYDPEEVMEVLTFADGMALLAAAEIAHIAGDSAFVELLLERSRGPFVTPKS